MGRIWKGTASSMMPSLFYCVFRMSAMSAEMPDIPVIVLDGTIGAKEAGTRGVDDGLGEPGRTVLVLLHDFHELLIIGGEIMQDEEVVVRCQCMIEALETMTV